MTNTYTPPARTAHGGAYWLWVGWWWAPLKWAGRVTLWMIAWPVGLWRSWANHKRNEKARERRGYEKTNDH